MGVPTNPESVMGEIQNHCLCPINPKGSTKPNQQRIFQLLWPHRQKNRGKSPRGRSPMRWTDRFVMTGHTMHEAIIQHKTETQKNNKSSSKIVSVQRRKNRVKFQNLLYKYTVCSIRSEMEPSLFPYLHLQAFADPCLQDIFVSNLPKKHVVKFPSLKNSKSYFSRSCSTGNLVMCILYNALKNLLHTVTLKYNIFRSLSLIHYNNARHVEI